MVASMKANRGFFPLNCNRANANAVTKLEAMVPMTTEPTIKNVFIIKWPK
ncbi:hypothetical protein SDC9_180342 [bioreactor metagenome]|uniref:Uncharacterized protein n=1 Tax=bioreactor metagenome TaxID=1076179 RepID=A0A645H4B8_9ZZZZ